jgi:cell division protease FtsH
MADREKLDELAQYLYQKETITGEEFMKILNG